MKRFFFVAALILITLTTGCSMSLEDVKNVPVFTKTYYVVFEDKPEIVNEGVFANNFEIGRISSQKPGSEDMVIVTMSVQNENNHLMTDNVIFYVSDGRLTYDTVGDSGNPLQEGAKILGFTGKTGLYWFKTKNKIKNISGAAIDKAQELYDRAVK
ncbi:hypothetical protein QUF80_19795 [Desulfococcaceae bacterium HSG8]|nr:hypothetical protein [Desulfococcaceae bacterium HSG8]